MSEYVSEWLKVRLTFANTCSVSDEDERPSLSSPPPSSSLGTGLTPADCTTRNNNKPIVTTASNNNVMSTYRASTTNRMLIYNAPTAQLSLYNAA